MIPLKNLLGEKKKEDFPSFHPTCERITTIIPNYSHWLNEIDIFSFDIIQGPEFPIKCVALNGWDTLVIW